MSTNVDNEAELDIRIRGELAPDLEVVRTLGTGACANVYLARESSLQRLVAVKVLRPQVAADDVLRRRFEREAQSAARITHPNVTAIYRVGRLRDEVPYIVMEYVEGRTLADVIESGVQLDAAGAREVLASIGSALAAAHDQGIVHRDVRPGNVLMDRNGRAVLGDFGIAALLDTGASAPSRLTTAGMRLGDTRYMSPEQIRGDPVVEQSDVYAFGVLATELLTGAGPFGRRSEAAMMAAHLKEEPKKLRETLPSADTALTSLIDACLSKDPHRRPLARDIRTRLSMSSAAAAVAAMPGVPQSAMGQLMHELRRRSVYQVGGTYGAIALAVMGLGQFAREGGLLSPVSYQRLIAVMFAGFPVVLVLSWLYDVRAGRVERTRGAHSARVRVLVWSTFTVVALGAALVAWLMLKGGQ
jgi:eukaryotic-like serine/threonine-protein kinase